MSFVPGLSSIVSCPSRKRLIINLNEIPAMKALVEMLELRGCTVSIEAMGCQKEIAQARVAKQEQADYVLALKKPPTKDLCRGR